MKRIFCYDFDVAKKNKNNPPFKRMLIKIYILAISYILMVIVTNINIGEYGIIIGYFFAFVMLFSFACLIFDFFISCRKLIGQMTVFVIGENDEVFKIAKTNNVDKKMAAGYYIGEKIGGNDSFFSTIGMIMGYVFNIKHTKGISLGINNPYVVNEILKDPSQLVDGTVYKIETIYDVKDKGEFYIIKCDYFNYEENKQYKNNEIRLSKSYNCLDELVDILRRRIDAK